MEALVFGGVRSPATQRKNTASSGSVGRILFQSYSYGNHARTLLDNRRSVVCARDLFRVSRNRNGDSVGSWRTKIRILGISPLPRLVPIHSGSGSPKNSPQF